MPKSGTGQELVVFKSGFLAECFVELLLLCRVFPVCLWSFGGGSKKANCALVHEWRPEGSHFVLRTGRDRFSSRGPGTGINYEKRVNKNVKFRSERSNRVSGPTFLDFPPFLGIFQLDESPKRVSFTAEPKFPEILTKWKATGFAKGNTLTVILVPRARRFTGSLQIRPSGSGDGNDSQSHRRSEARERNTCYGTFKLWWHRWTKACSKSSWQTKNETALKR